MYYTKFNNNNDIYIYKYVNNLYITYSYMQKKLTNMLIKSYNI